MDHFFNTYSESLKKLTYILELYPGDRPEITLYQDALDGKLDLDKKDKYHVEVLSDLVLLSIQGGHIDAVKTLIQQRDGMTFQEHLDRATYFGNLDMVKVIANHIGTNIPYNIYDTAYRYAEAKGHDDVMKFLSQFTS